MPSPTKQAPSGDVATVRAMPGESLRFQVASKSEPGNFHMVDLGAYEGSGECSCKRWQTVSWPLIRDAHNLPVGKRCRHIRAAREMALNLTIRQYLEEHCRQ